MAIPVVTDHFQAQWIWLGPSGLPTDVFVTTWYFRNDGVGGSNPGPAIEAALLGFWDSVNGTAVSSLKSRIPDSITTAKLKVTDLGEPLPRYPVHEATITPVTVGNSSPPLPREVAVVNSFYGGQGPRMRGRNYLGPWVNSVVEEDANNVPRVASFLQEWITESALALRDTTENVTWVQMSTTYGIATPVLGGWVDDAFDTQRSRGKDPSARLTWGTPASG